MKTTLKKIIEKMPSSASYLALLIALICLLSSCYIPRNGLYENEKGKRYFENDVYKSGWIEIDGGKYYFSMIDGYMLTAPTVISGELHYFHPDGKVVNGFFDTESDDGSQVRVYCRDGLPVRGWQTIEGKKYYFRLQDGYMTVGDVTISGEDYSFNSDGSLKGYSE